jgi:hypothetical protein
LALPDRPLKPEEFADYPVLEQAAGSAKNTYYGPWRREHGFRFRKVFSTNSLTVLRELTIEGLGMPLVYSAVFRNDAFTRALDVIAEVSQRVCDFRRGPHDLAAAAS